MDFNEITEALNNGSLTLNPEELVEIVVQAVTKDEHINCDTLNEIITSLQSVKKTAKTDFDEVKKQKTKENREVMAELGKKYFDTLQKGDPISWYSTGKILKGTKGVMKDGAKSAHCVLDEIPTDSKAKTPRADRFVKYYNIIVPEDFE